MDTSEIKSRIHNFIEYADERVLNIFNAIIEAEEKQLPAAVREELDTRLQYHKDNPEEGKTWEEVRGSLKKKYGL